MICIVAYIHLRDSIAINNQIQATSFRLKNLSGQPAVSDINHVKHHPISTD